MNVIVSNTLTITDYPEEVLQWCRKNLIIPNPEYAKKARMHLWLGNTPAKLSLFEQRGKELVLPFGTLRRFPEFAPKDTEYAPRFAEAPLVAYGGKEVPLYPYQEEAVESVYKAKYGILQSPAGSGKTQMGIALVKKFGRRALWLTHTLDLLNQSKSRAEMYLDNSLIGTITEGKVNIGEGITFATIQTMCKLDMSRYKDLWDIVIVDECHRCTGTPTAMTQFYKVLNALSARHKIGLSATVHRSDGMIAATYALLGEIIYTVPEEAVGDKIMKVGICPVGTGVGMSRECMNTDGTLNYQKLISYLCDNRDRLHFVASWIVSESEHSCLILSDRLEHLENLMNCLPAKMRADAVMVSGKMTSKKGKAEREQAIKDMRTGRKKYLFATYSLCKEGLDIPRLDRLFMTTPVKDYAVVVQSIGRIARTFEGKDEPIVYDFVDNIGYLMRAYKQRCRHYKKAGAYFIEKGED
jgi:superfamily II DNA or RNA helicase